MSTTTIETQLHTLLTEIRQTVKQGKENTKPNKKVFRGRKLYKFQYLKPMLTEAGSKEYDIEKDDWDFAIYQIYHHIKDSKLYQELAEIIQTAFPAAGAERLDNFVLKTTQLYLYDKASGFNSSANLVKAFIKELNDKPLLHKIDFEITGVAMKPNFIKISKNTFLRKTTRRDVEQPVPVEDFISHRKYGHDSLATLHVEYYAKNDYIEFHKWELILTILRLYKVADVQYNSVRELSESTKNWLSWYGEKHLFSNHHYIFGSYLTRKDIPKLSKFWKTIQNYLPDSFKVTFTQSDYKAIAYQRYMEAMTHPGDEEMRIAYGVSALESLFSKREPELGYKLKMRVSRILGLMGMNSEKVYDDIGLAYDVRSTFDHGERLDSKKKIEIRNKYNAKDERILTMIILDYVRISLITILMSQPKANSNRYLVDLIDKSFVSQKKLSELRKILRKPTALLNLKSYKPQYSISPFNNADFSYVK